MKIDIKKIRNLEWEDIDPRDYPDFTDAFIVACDYGNREATEEELDYINDNFKDSFYDDLIQSCI